MTYHIYIHCIYIVQYIAFCIYITYIPHIHSITCFTLHFASTLHYILHYMT